MRAVSKVMASKAMSVPGSLVNDEWLWHIEYEERKERVSDEGTSILNLYTRHTISCLTTPPTRQC